jgi:hypothetical protein
MIKFNNFEIEVKKYLPIQDKLRLISNVINNSLSESTEGFYNPVKVDVFAAVEAVMAYTNIEFTEEEKENIPMLYDLFVSTGFLDTFVKEGIGEFEFFQIKTYTEACIRAIYDYDHSAMGILEKLNTDYTNLNLDVTTLHEKLADANALPLLKDIMDKLG